MPRPQKKALTEGITFEEMRRAKYDFALGDDARICKQLNDLMRVLRSNRSAGPEKSAGSDRSAGPDRAVEQEKRRRALALLGGPIMKIAGARRKSLRRVMEFVAAEIGRGRADSASEVLEDLMGGIFRHSPQGIHCWGEYRRRFERLFPEVIRYHEPLSIKLQDYNTLVVQFLRQGAEAYRLEVEHEDYEKAHVVFTAVVGCQESGAVGSGRRSVGRGQWAGVGGEGSGESIEARVEWWTLRAQTFTMLEHKSIRVELPVRGDWRVDFMGKPGIECRLDYGPASGQRAGLYVADRKGRLVRVFCDGGHDWRPGSVLDTKTTTE